MSESKGRFNPPNIFSELAWNAVWTHVTKQNTKNIIGIYNCKIFYSTYISLISSYTNLSNTDNIEIDLNEGLKSFFQWAGINKNRFISDSEKFISYFSDDLSDPYVNHFSRLFYNEIKELDPLFSINYSTPYFMLLFEVDSPTDDNEIYDDQYFFDCDIEISRIEEFFEIVRLNFQNINAQFDLNLRDKDKLKLQSWPSGHAKNMISDKDFFKKLVIKPFSESRCQICGNYALREKLALKAESSEGWVLPMCTECFEKNI
jgi:hypothetical protein